MSNSFPTGSFGSSHHTDALWQAMDQLRSKFEKRVSGRVGRGEVRTAVLALLAEQPMHGYQIIREIEDRSGGSWKPSAGSVYPTLQMLADEGLITAEESNGRKTYTLTEAGREEAAEMEPPSQEETGSGRGAAFAELSKSGLDLGQAVSQVGRTGSPDQVKEAVAVLDEARRKLYSILAQD